MPSVYKRGNVVAPKEIKYEGKPPPIETKDQGNY